MLRRRSLSRIATPLVTLLLIATVATATAVARPDKDHKEKRGGKKPLGKIVSFDSTTMMLTLVDKEGADHTFTVAADAKVKITHRGEHDATEEHSPSNGTLDDLVADAMVLRVKRVDDVVVKIRLKLPKTDDAVEEPSVDGEDEDAGDEGDGDDDSETDV